MLGEVVGISKEGKDHSWLTLICSEVMLGGIEFRLGARWDGLEVFCRNGDFSYATSSAIYKRKDSVVGNVREVINKYSKVHRVALIQKREVQ
ncbi:22129_t:CDS:2, partial [Gigaspora rosea]